jgi:hypothetical protein
MLFSVIFLNINGNYCSSFFDDLLSFLPPKAKPAANNKLMPPSIGMQGPGSQQGGKPPPGGGGGATTGGPAANTLGINMVKRRIVVSNIPNCSFFSI